MAEGKALGKNDLFESDAFNDAIKGADTLLNIIRETNKEIKLSLAAQKEFVSAFKPKSFDDVKKLNNELRQTSDLIKMKQQLEVAELKVLQQQQTLEQAAIRTAIEKNKLTREQLKAENDLAKAIDAETKANQRAQQQLKQTNGEYKKGVQALAAVKQQLKELEFTGRTNGKLFKALSQEFTELDRRVRGAETSVGEFQRNVGNYAGAWNGLGNSINQLSREMPAFANSISTGFMAISNNLPQLFDEINKIKKANVELAKSGAPTTSAFKQVLSGIFSWQTALSVGVTLLTLYGAKMIDFIGNLFSAEAAFEDGAEAIDANTKAIERNKQALIDLQKQVDEIIKKELELDGTLSDLDLARVNAFNDYEKNLDDIQKLRKQAAEDQIKAAAQSISDEEDRVEFLAKLETTEVAGVMTVSMKKGIIRKDFSEEEIKIIQATNSKLLGLRSQYDRMEVKAAELLNEQLAAAKREFDKKAAEQEKKKREEEDKQLEEWVKKRRALIAKLYELMAETPDTDKTKFKGLQGDIQEMEDLIVKGYSRFEDAQKKAAKEFNMSQEDLMAEFYASGIEMFEDFLDQKRKLMERDKKLTKDVIQSVDKVVLNIDKI
jgi:chromosome segregation ATPase